MVKYVPSEMDSRSDRYSSRWSEVSAAKGSQEPHHPAPKARTPNRKNQRADDEEAKPMNQDIPQEAIEELKNLATQMALIKSKYGIHEA